MKKHLLIVLAAAGLAACAQEEYVAVPQSDAIAFDGSFVENATRAAEDPSTTFNSIEDFNVWGFMDETNGTVFNGDEVEKVGSAWSYANTQYWAPEHTYYFAAVSPAEPNNWELQPTGANKLGAGVLSFTNVEGLEDLLYATAKVTTPGYAELSNKGMDKVKFEFAHLLSKVKFTFKNGFTTNNVTVKVTDIKMTAPAKAEIDLDVAEPTWALDAGTLDLAFGDVPVLAANASDECATELFTIPADNSYTYTITFGIDVYMGAQKALHVDKTSTVTAVALEMGKAYNFTAEINPENLELPAIEFDVDVDQWAQPTIDVQHPVIATLNGEAYYSLQAAVDAAVAGDNTITLISDVKENVTIKQAQDINLVIEGNGKSYDGVLTINGDARSTGRETLTIQNVNFRTSHNIDTKESEWTFITAPTKVDGRYNYSHNVTIQGCTFQNMVDGILRVGSANFQQAYNIVMKNCKATNMHSLFQAQSIDNNVTVEDVEVVASKNGVSFGNTKNATLKKAKIEAKEYGVRADGNREEGSSLYAENVEIAAKQPIVVRKNTKPYSVTLSGTNTLTPGDYYHVVFTTGSDDAAYVAPAAGNYAITGADDLLVYPRNARVATAEAFKAAAANDSPEIVLEPGAVIDITDEIVYIKKDVTIISYADNKTTLKGKFVAEGDINVSNVKFVANAKSNAALEGGTYGTYATGTYSSIVTIHESAANFVNCEFDGGENYVPALNYFKEVDGKVLNVTGCKFTKTWIYSKVLCNITGNEFDLQDCPYPICVWPRYTGEGSCIFTGNEVTSNFAGDKAYCQLYFLSQTAPYANVEINVNNSGNFQFPFGLASAAKFATDRSVTFAPGSLSFTINPSTGRP